MKDDGEVEKINLWSIYGLIITDEGYFLCDNSINKNAIVDELGKDDMNLTSVIDNIIFYNYEGEVIKQYYLNNEDLTNHGYKLKNIVYTGKELLVIYSGENGDLDIEVIKVL